MIAVHLVPGPRGYAVITDTGIVAEKLSSEEAWLLVLNGEEPPKVTGHPSPIAVNPQMEHDRIEYTRKSQRERATRQGAGWPR